MEKKLIVRLTDAERESLCEMITKRRGALEKVRRAQILLKADVEGPTWTDNRSAQAFACRTKTEENLRRRLGTESGDLPVATDKNGLESPQVVDRYYYIPEGLGQKGGDRRWRPVPL